MKTYQSSETDSKQKYAQYPGSPEPTVGRCPGWGPEVAQAVARLLYPVSPHQHTTGHYIMCLYPRQMENSAVS